MKDALDLKSKSGIHRLITALEERGFLRRMEKRARALEIVKLPENVADTQRPATSRSQAQRLTQPPATRVARGERCTHYGRYPQRPGHRGAATAMQP